MLELAVTATLLWSISLGSNEGIEYSPGASLHLSHPVTDYGFYGWGQAEWGKVRLLGQNVASMPSAQLGVGYSHDIQPRLSLHVEAGFSYPVSRPDRVIAQEVVYTYLVGRHQSEWRPIPVFPEFPYDQDSYETTWEVDWAPVIKFGATFEVTEDLLIQANYRYYRPEVLLEIYDEESRNNGRGWWQEYQQLNANTVEVGVSWRF